MESINKRVLSSGKTYINVDLSEVDEATKEQLCMEFLREVVALGLSGEPDIFNLGYAIGFLQGRGHTPEQIPHFEPSQTQP